MLANNIESFRKAYHEHSYRLYDDHKIQSLLRKHFSRAVLNAYLDLAPFAFKADLARYCLLYHFGGVYSDLSYMHLMPVIMPPKKNIAVFSGWGFSTPTWEMSNSLLVARPRQNIFKAAIKHIIQTINKSALANHR